MILEALRRHGTKANLFMLYPQEWNVPVGNGSNSLYKSRLLAQARDVYGTKLSPIKVKTFMNNDDPTWQAVTQSVAVDPTQVDNLITCADHMIPIKSSDHEVPTERSIYSVVLSKPFRGQSNTIQSHLII